MVLEFGQIDIVVADLGIAQQAVPVESLPGEVWHQMLDVNLTGVFFSNKYVIAQMKRQGRRRGRQCRLGWAAGRHGMQPRAAW